MNLAKNQSREILIQLDANAKLGNHIIYNDPHEMSANGKVFYDFVSHQDLVVLNSLDKCKGTITRERTALNRKESSVLDYIVASNNLAQFLCEMWIDEEKEYSLCRFH